MTDPLRLCNPYQRLLDELQDRDPSVTLTLVHCVGLSTPTIGAALAKFEGSQMTMYFSGFGETADLAFYNAYCEFGMNTGIW